MERKTHDVAQEPVPGPDQSNQVRELAAVIIALQNTPHFQPLKIISDSRYVIQGLTGHLPNWEDQGWIQIKNAKILKKMAYLLKCRSAVMTFKWVKGHSGNLGNDESDHLAKAGAMQQTSDNMNLDVPKEFNLQGVKLAVINQSVAYQGIRGTKTTQLLQTTQSNLQAAKEAIRIVNRSRETDTTIWLRALHNAYMIRERWMHIPNFKLRALCSVCRETETMQHILLECNAIACHIVWHMAKELWPHDPQEWPDITIGTILVGHMIWVFRCRRVINQEELTTQQIKTRWIRAINKCLTMDKIIATKIK
ncbi:ribonuclease H-like domain-containing protein [Russula compacta]|nr:ribonuclease H-like domain-containing protein [Russula compacta]